jgi:molybdenum cofactor biosynthesis enzyme MoaA
MNNVQSRVRRTLVKHLSNQPKIKAVLAAADINLTLIAHSAATVLPQVIQPATRTMEVAITARCNLKCVGCRYGRDFMVGSQLSWEMTRDLLDDASAAGISSVRLYGGEPLLHPDLPKMVEHCRRVNLTPYVTTNAVLLEKRIDELYAAGLRSITVGFYGTGTEYDEYVQRRNQFARMEAGISAVRSRYGENVRMQLNWLLSTRSCDTKTLSETVRFAERYKLRIQVDLIHYSLPYFSEGPERELQFRPEDRSRIEAVVSELVRLQRANPALFNHSEVGLRSITDWLLKGPEMRVPCDKYNMIWVGADGTVQLCYVTFRLGNLHEKRLSEMLFTDAHKRAARGAFSLACPNCHCGYDTRIQKHAPSRSLYSH